MITVYDIVDATCKTGGCDNSNITISVYRRPSGTVMCGVCGNTITDVVKTGQVSLDE